MSHIFYRKGYKYQLAEDYHGTTRILPEREILTRFIHMNTNGEFTVFEAYAWDGPSGPTIDTKTFIRPSLCHDVKYQLIRQGHLPYADKEIADEELHEDCIEDGMWKPRAWWVFNAVSMFGDCGLNISAEPPIQVAP